MAYHDLSECTLDADERRAEATRICDIIADDLDFYAPHEQKFIVDISSYDRAVSVKQLFWLRDLRDKR
jgi:hypothetical protein